MCRDGLGNCTLWNTSMYERHAPGGEILALVKVAMHGETLMNVEENVRYIPIDKLDRGVRLIGKPTVFCLSFCTKVLQDE